MIHSNTILNTCILYKTTIVYCDVSLATPGRESRELKQHTVTLTLIKNNSGAQVVGAFTV